MTIFFLAELNSRALEQSVLVLATLQVKMLVTSNVSEGRMCRMARVVVACPHDVIYVVVECQRLLK